MICVLTGQNLDDGGAGIADVFWDQHDLFQFDLRKVTDRWLVTSTGRLKARNWSKLSARRVWDAVYPEPGREELAADENLVSVEYLEEGQPHLRVVDWMEPGALLEEHQLVEELQRGSFVRFNYRAVHGRGLPGTVGTKSLMLSDLGKWRRVDQVWLVPNMPCDKCLLRGWMTRRGGTWMQSCKAWNVSLRPPWKKCSPEAFRQKNSCSNKGASSAVRMAFSPMPRPENAPAVGLT